MERGKCRLVDGISRACYELKSICLQILTSCHDRTRGLLAKACIPSCPREENHDSKCTARSLGWVGRKGLSRHMFPISSIKDYSMKTVMLQWKTMMLQWMLLWPGWRKVIMSKASTDGQESLLYVSEVCVTIRITIAYKQLCWYVMTCNQSLSHSHFR